MNIEERIRSELRSAAEAMPERRHDLPSTLRTAKKGLRWQRASLAAAAVAVLAVAVVSIDSLVPDDRVGVTVPPGTGGTPGFDASEIEATIESFHALVTRNDVEGSWAMLTPEAKERIGTTQDWAKVMRDLRVDIGWVDEPEVTAAITRLPRPDAETYLATYTAPIREGSALLEVFTLEGRGSELLVDLDVRHDISLEPESPRFMACSSPCEPEELWPEVSDGDTFSVVLERTRPTFTTTIDNVWFAMGGDAWVGEARLIEGADDIRAQVTFEPRALRSGENVFTVTIETSDGALETYGYRVIYTEP